MLPLQFLFVVNESDPTLNNITVVVEVDGVMSTRSATVTPDPADSPITDSCSSVLWQSAVSRHRTRTDTGACIRHSVL